MRTRRAQVGSLVAALLVTAACGGMKPPVEIVGKADLAVQRAAESEAREYAPLELRIATEKLEAAKRAMAAEEHARARRLAEQALVDAQLAEAKARSESARERAAELRQSIEALRDEAGRGGRRR